MKARKRALLGNDLLLSIQEGQNRPQQLDLSLNEEPNNSTAGDRKRAPARCSGCGNNWI